MQAAQDITVGARLAKTQYQYTLTDADQNELNRWSAIFLDKLRSLPQITDVTSDQENAGPRLNVTVNRDVASSFGILPSTVDNTLDDAFGQRIVSTIFTRAQSVSRRPRGRSALPARPGGAQRHLREFVEPGSRCRSAPWSTATSRRRRS